jgi:hypothetical protein
MTKYRLQVTIEDLQAVVRMEEKELRDHRKAIKRAINRIRDVKSRIAVLRRQLKHPIQPDPKLGKVEYVRMLLQANGCEYYFDKKKTLYSLKILRAPKEVVEEIAKQCDKITRHESRSGYYRMSRHLHPNRPKEMITRYWFKRPA